jgi:hypothetical protein
LTSLAAALDRLPQGRTATVRQCARSLAWTLGFVGLFALWYLIERYGLAPDKSHRLVQGAALVPMVIIGVPHILIGFLFLATSRRMRSWRSYAMLAGFFAAGVGLCALYALAGGHEAANKLPAAAVTIYFVVHELRDEAFFYRVLGDAPKTARPARFLDATTAILIAIATGVGAWLYDAYAHRKHPPRNGPLDYVFPSEVGEGWRAVAVLVPLVLFVAWQYRRWAQDEPGGVRATFSRHKPMAVVYLLFLLVIAAGAALSGQLLAAIVLWHVLEWFRFGTAQAARSEASAAPPVTWLAKVRGTRRGFLTLHIGLSIAIFLLMLVWAYGQGRTGPLTPLVSSNAFYYWTIMHVTLSFFPR